MPTAIEDFTVNLPAKIQSDVKAAGEIGAVFLFRITGKGGGVWAVNLSDNPGVTSGEVEDPTCTLELSAEDWNAISDDPSKAMQLYFDGDLKVSGESLRSSKLKLILGDAAGPTTPEEGDLK